MDMIFGIRAVIEAIQAGQDIDTIYIKKDLQRSDILDELLALIRNRHLVMRRVPVEKLNKFTRKNHQGVVASLSAVPYHSLGHIVIQLYEDGQVPLLVILDSITDVRNFGAIARTAECAGVNALVIPETGSVSIQADAVKTSAGALLRIPVCREHTIPAALRFLKDNGYSIVGSTEKAEILYTQADMTVPTAIVMGSEDTGIDPRALALCDSRVRIPMFGHIGSLNVSVATGVMIYEAVRQRMASGMDCVPR